MSNPYETMAQDIFFNGGKIEDILNKHGMKLKNGKENKDFIGAFNSGIGLGCGKFEREMMYAGMELKKVCEKQ